MRSSLLPFLLPLTFKRVTADSAPEISVEIYFQDYTIHRFNVDPFAPANCNWIPFHFLPGSKTITPSIFAITASPQLPPTVQLDSLDFSIHLGDNAIGCEDARQTSYLGGVTGEAYNLTLPIYQATGRTLRLRPGEHDPALDIDLSDPEMSAIIFPPRQRNPVSQPPKLNTESANAKSDAEELDASPEIFDEDRPLERPLMAEFNAVLGQDANYGDNERLTQTSGEKEDESPIDMGGNFNYDFPDGDQREGDPDSPVIKKRSLSTSPSATKRLHKRVIEVPEVQPDLADQLELVQPDPVQPDPAEPTPSPGFGESGQIAMDAQAQLRRADRFVLSQEPYKLLEAPASFVIRAKLSEKKVSDSYKFQELEDLPPLPNYDPEDLLNLSDSLLEFLSRERPYKH
ncbi:hypothetical protein TWF192_008802 [Orbilia oligospora]|nr:hypothetical protein TWF192_008802 [Orbilia oligospora]